MTGAQGEGKGTLNMRRCPSRNGRWEEVMGSVGGERWSNTLVTAMRGDGTEAPPHSAGRETGTKRRRGEGPGGDGVSRRRAARFITFQSPVSRLGA